MAAEKLNLQYVLINCDFPDSPLYEENIATIIARRLSDYVFARGEKPKEYSLFHSKPQSRFNISFGNLSAIAESFASGELGGFLSRIGDLLNSILQGTKVASARRVYARCRFFLRSDKPKQDFENLVHTAFLKKEPGILSEFFDKAELYDIQPPVFSYALSSTTRCVVFARVVYSDGLLQEMFPNTFEECKPGGLVISVEVEQIEISNSNINFSEFIEMIEQKAPYIAQRLLDFIIDPTTEAEAIFENDAASKGVIAENN